jgi:hypothetical protein
MFVLIGRLLLVCAVLFWDTVGGWWLLLFLLLLAIWATLFR